MGQLGNEQNMAIVQSLMEDARKVNAGGNLNEGVEIDFTSMDGNLYRGTVVFKRMTIMDYLKVGAIKSEIFREAGVKDLNLLDPTFKFMAHVIATLKTVIVKRPEWLLNIDEVEEPELLYHIYGKFEVWDSSFRKDADNQENDGNSKASQSEEALED